MKKLMPIFLALLMLTGCTLVLDTQQQEELYMTITAQQAKELMDTETNYMILDTRTLTEYETERIPGAICIPYDEILEKAEELLTDKNQLLLVYCRSGHRSKLACDDLVKLGYTQIRDFGGIIDWPYDMER